MRICKTLSSLHWLVNMPSKPAQTRSCPSTRPRIQPLTTASSASSLDISWVEVARSTLWVTPESVAVLLPTCLAALFNLSRQPAASDFDDWKTPGWTLKELLPALRKCEKFEPWPNDPLHGYDGPLAVSYGGTELEIAKEWMASSQACGIPKVQDAQNFNTGCATWRWPKWSKRRACRSRAFTD